MSSVFLAGLGWAGLGCGGTNEKYGEYLMDTHQPQDLDGYLRGKRREGACFEALEERGCVFKV